MAVRRDPRRSKHRVFQLFIAGPGGKLAADRRTRLPGGRRDAGVSGQVRGIGEVLAIADGQQDVRGSRDAYAGHRHQDLGKRERFEHLLDLSGDRVALCLKRFDVRRQLGNDQFCCRSAGYRDSLLGKGSENCVNQGSRVLLGAVAYPLQDPASTCGGQFCRTFVVDERVQHQRARENLACKDALECGVNLCEHAAKAVFRSGGVFGDVVVESGEHLQR